jgi:hypothetical protein
MLNSFLSSYSYDMHISEVTNHYKSNFDVKFVQNMNSYLVQNRFFLHHANKAVSDVVYERNVIFFLKITRDHTIVGLKSVQQGSKM